ncbi:MAG: M48 family metallopeptidase [Bilifractor sp.]
MEQAREYQVIRSRKRHKSITLQITPDERLVVRAPYYASTAEIQRFVSANQSWIDQNLARVKRQRAQRRMNPDERITEDEIRRLSELASHTIPPRAAYYASLMGVTYGRITIRHQKTRWGSCSAKGNLNFNCLLMLTPPDVQDYVIVHELCHRKQMNHSRLFWDEVRRVMPDYRQKEQWLKENGTRLIMRSLVQEN